MWSLGATGLKVSEPVYNQLSHPNTRVIDASDPAGPGYENLIAAPSGVWQLVSQDGYAKLIAP
jgi:hypothetical protein